MYDTFQSKVVITTGASSGIGRAVAHLLADEGTNGNVRSPCFL